jgi:hypothetical protein
MAKWRQSYRENSLLMEEGAHTRIDSVIYFSRTVTASGHLDGPSASPSAAAL